MNDKYEEFKEWYKASEYNNATSTNLLFKEFEKKQIEKQKEEEIKSMMMHIIATTPLRIVNLECGEVWCSDKVVDKIYDALKEKDLIK